MFTLKYHAKLEYAQSSHYWWNHSEDKISENLVLPFINGQVIMLKSSSGGDRLFNMKNATFLRIYKTEGSISATESKSIIDQIGEKEFQRNDCTPEFLNKVKAEHAGPQLTSLLQKAFQPAKPQVFVVMKFGDEILDSAYKESFKPTIKKFKLSCVRIDEIEDSKKISDQILEMIAESKYVIADLSGARPNCYYEAGFAHALGKEIILTIRDGESAHFDLQGHRFIQWKTESDLRRQLTKRLKALEDKSGSEG
jgi:nucleoside 2-deoxyribosyltransferase